MPVVMRPQLRPHLAASPEDRNGRRYIVHDLLRLNGTALRLSALEVQWLRLFDGQHSLRDIQAEAMRQADGQLVPLEVFTRLASALDEALFLEGPRFRDRGDDPIRRPACVGAYEADPDALRRQIGRLFTGPGGPGLPGEPAPDGRLRAAADPAHRLRPRRPHLRLGLQGSLPSAPTASLFVDHRHVALQRPSLHADAQGLPDAARHRPHRPGLHRSPGPPLRRRPVRRRMAGPLAGALHRAGSGVLAVPLTRANGRSASCRWWSARSRTACRTGSRRRSRTTSAGWSRRCGRRSGDQGADLLHHQRRPGPHRPEVRRPASRSGEPGWTTAASRTRRS